MGSRYSHVDCTLSHTSITAWISVSAATQSLMRASCTFA